MKKRKRIRFLATGKRDRSAQGRSRTGKGSIGKLEKDFTHGLSRRAILTQFCINSQSDIIYSPTSGTSQDIPDVPSPTPLAKRELICERYFVGTWSAMPKATSLSALIPLHCTFSRKNLWTSCWDARGAPNEDNLIHFGPL